MSVVPNLLMVLAIMSLTTSMSWLNQKVVSSTVTTSLSLEFLSTLTLATTAGLANMVWVLNMLTMPTSGGVSWLLSMSVNQTGLFFHAILVLALMICFLFLSEYFSYDHNAKEMMMLSALFSQLAFVFFSANDMVSLVILWEWMSITSFFLVRFWSARVATNKAALKVFTFSQLGDIVFLYGAMLLINVSSTSDMLTHNSLSISWRFSEHTNGSWGYMTTHTAMALTLMTALLLKAAQVVFYPWLLDAMEAPVPMSAQLHSSTLVIIGFYVFWLYAELMLSERTSSLILMISGSVTALGASLLGFWQCDGKSLLACSTAGQLGYVVVAVGAGYMDEAAHLLLFCCCNKAYTFVWFGALMEKNGGLSDFSLMRSGALSIVESLGLLSAALNTTMAPGAFVWHVKSLLSAGSVGGEFSHVGLALNVLAATWFLSSAYMCSLVWALNADMWSDTGYAPNPSSSTASVSTALFTSLVVLFFVLVGAQGWWLVSSTSGPTAQMLLV